jgi:hypothetical protein
VLGNAIPERGLILKDRISTSRRAEVADDNILQFLFALLANIGPFGKSENMLRIHSRAVFLTLRKTSQWQKNNHHEQATGLSPFFPRGLTARPNRITS